jgi:uncharacterized protein (DUF1778 family)
MLYTACMPDSDPVRVTIRTSRDEREAWKEAAWKRRVSLSEWMKRVLNATASQMKEEK